MADVTTTTTATTTTIIITSDRRWWYDVDYDDDDDYHLAFPEPLNSSLVLAGASRPGQWHKEALQKWTLNFLKISSWTALYLHQVSKTPGDDGVVVAGHVEGNRPTSEAKAAQIWTYLAKKLIN